MAIPAMDMKVTAKKATWHFVGYLPKGMGYNHKKYVLRMSNSNGILKGHAHLVKRIPLKEEVRS